MNPIDHHVLAYLNQFAGKSWTFDAAVELLAHNDNLKTGVFTGLLFWTWFREGERQAEDRATLIFGVLASGAALVVARLLAISLPFRERPLRVPDLHFVLPHSIGRHAVLGWSAFPSDNATLFFGLATCLFLVSRKAGLLALAHACLVVAFARVYLGLHYPTDILGGALLGVSAVLLVRVPALRSAVTRWPMEWLRDHPQSFHAAFCMLVVFVSSTFIPLWTLIRFGAGAVALAIATMDESGWRWLGLVSGVLLIAAAVWLVSRRLRLRHRRSA